jgi:O-antigen/teichoic acid export membrane protein
MTLKHKYFNRFLQNDLLKNTSILVIGTVISQLINFAFLPFLSRIYSPEDFGIFSFFLSLTTIIGTIAAFRFESLIVPAKDENKAKKIFQLSIFSAIFFWLLITSIIFLIPVSIKSSIGILEFDALILFAAFSGLIVSLSITCNNWLNRKSDYSLISKLQIYKAILFNFIAIFLLGYLELSGLILATLISNSIVAIFLIWSLKDLFVNASHFNLRKSIIENQSSPRYLFPSTLLDVLSMQLPLILIMLWFVPEDAGQYGMAWRILALPMSLIGAALGQVFFKNFSKTYPDKMAARKLLFKIWKINSILAFFPFFIIFVYGEQLFMMLLGNDWGGAGVIGMVMSPMLYMMFVFSPTSSALIVLGFQSTILKFGILTLVCRPLAIYIGAYNNDLIMGITFLVIFEMIAILLYQIVVIKNLK